VRDKPWRPLAAVAACVVVVILWPAGQQPKLVRAVPTTVTAQPLLPNATNAVVPAPGIWVHGGPAAIQCPAHALRGSLTFTVVGQHRLGVLRLRLAPSAGPGCRLPGMLDGLRLLDRAGAVRGRGLDPRTGFPINPPSLAPVGLSPGQTATMYVRPATERSCTARLVRAEFTIGTAAIAVPVTGLPGCATSTRYWYGPFSTAKYPVSLAPPSWKSLSASLDFPVVMHRNSATTFHVTLTNHSGQAAPFPPCPEFGIVLAGARQVAIGNGAMKCPRPIAPGASIKLTLTYSVNAELPPGAYSVQWAIAGAPTARASTTVIR
jgi:hypothetical protein